jgi:hypothetical protein
MEQQFALRGVLGQLVPLRNDHLINANILRA